MEELRGLCGVLDGCILHEGLGLGDWRPLGNARGLFRVPAPAFFGGVVR